MSTNAANTTVITGDGRRVRLGALIKSGGAGSVYRLHDNTTQVAKLYHANVEHAMYSRKVAAMLELTPDLPDLEAGGERFVQLAWPQAAIYDGAKKFLGYLMPVVDIDGTSELECILQERQARAHKLPTGLGAKVTLAANLSAVIAALHRMQHCVVDLKPVNLRFYRRSLYMAMLDCDGFSIQGHGERFVAPQFTPDYLAPEFHARALTAAGEQQQDRFALAVVVFQLLNFGIHPFTGRPQSDKVPTDIPARIAGRWYSHGIKPNPSILPSPTSGHAHMPADLRQLFDRAFENAGGTRPSADEWSASLRNYAQRSAGKLVVCGRDAAHQHFAGDKCAACVRQDVLTGAKAAARANPVKRAPAVGRHVPLATRTARVGRPPPRVPGTTAPPASPNVLGSARQRWAQGAATAAIARASVPPAPPRRPANWPAPPPVHVPHAATGPSATMVELYAVVAFLVLILLGWGMSAFSNWRKDAAAEAAAEQRRAQRQAAVVAPASPGIAPTSARRAAVTAAAVPMPTSYELQMFQRQIDGMAADVNGGNAYAFAKALSTMRGEADLRQDHWLRVVTAEASGGVAPVMRVEEIRTAGTLMRHEAWKSLEGGYRVQAQAQFLQALWADPRDPDAWFGYGLTQAANDAEAGSNVLAIALLHYRDPAAAKARRDEMERHLWANGVSRVDANRTFDRAAYRAERMRKQVPPNTVPLAEPFRWSLR